MPDLHFTTTGVRASEAGMTPLLEFEIEVENKTPAQAVQSVLLEAQIRIEPVRRSYSAEEREKLRELFGEPDQWGRTLQSLVWTHAGVTIPRFSDRTAVRLPVPCTYDLNLAATKYFYGLENGVIPLIFLFRGTVFYSDSGGRLLMERISWERESRFPLEVRVWRSLMDQHYPNSAWLYLRRDVFDELYALKRRTGIATWDGLVSHLLEQARPPEATT